MFAAVLLTHSEPTAAGVGGAWTFKFVGHWFTSLLGHEKSRCGNPQRLGQHYLNYSLIKKSSGFK